MTVFNRDFGRARRRDWDKFAHGLFLGCAFASIALVLAILSLGWFVQ